MYATGGVQGDMNPRGRRSALPTLGAVSRSLHVHFKSTEEGPTFRITAPKFPTRDGLRWPSLKVAGSYGIACDTITRCWSFWIAVCSSRPCAPGAAPRFVS